MINPPKNISEIPLIFFERISHLTKNNTTLVSRKVIHPSGFQNPNFYKKQITPIGSQKERVTGHNSFDITLSGFFQEIGVDYVGGR